jgi:anaphase-promoting complex subunit 2
MASVSTAVASSPALANHPAGRMKPSDVAKWKRAFARAKSYKTRPSTVAATEFFDRAHTSAENTNGASERWRTLPDRLVQLCNRLLVCDGAEDVPSERKRLAFTAAVFAAAPPDFLESFRDMFAAALAVRQAQWNHDSEDDEDEEDDEMESLSPPFNEVEVYEALRALGWTQTKLAKPMGQALHDTILSAVRDMVGGEFEDGTMLEQVAQTWKGTVIAPWVRDVVGLDAYEADAWDSKLDFAVAECFATIRIGEIFDIVATFPDSLPAVHELRDALDRTRMHTKLATELRASLSRRLIHPGANTSQIISVYCNVIKLLREIDPSDGLLDVVAEPVRSYLRGRNDTVRCIVTSLTDENSGGDLYEELRRQDARPLEQAQMDSEDEGDAPDYDWSPPPSLFKQRGTMGHVSQSGGTGDILSMLVGIYGSKELFVNEYRVMLADKLLANLAFDTDKEVHNLELLKLRFGELSMRQCEIMIKDIDDSKRINTNIHETIVEKKKRHKEDQQKKKRKKTQQPPEPAEVDEPVVDCAIVSHIFWPALQKEQFKNHPRIQSQLDEFSLEYAAFKNPRRLIWHQMLGTVQIELEVVDEDGGGSHMQEFTCSTLHATLISHFEDKQQWTLEDLANETGLSEDVVRKKMGYWINNRVVQLVKGKSGGSTVTKFELTSVDELADTEHDSAAESDYYEDDGEDHALSARAQQAEEMQVYESYIFGMLTNLGQLPLDRIHNNLKMFASGSDHKYDKTARQLSTFLQKLCKEEKLECAADGMYRVLKK